ncbi:MAG TPA: isochorismatase family protein, partial [Pirellulales bacterium]
MSHQALPRSPELMSPRDAALVVIDVQEKLVPAIHESARVVWNVGRLIDGAKILELPVVATEQYPKGLGPTLTHVREKIAEAVPDKLAFSAAACGDLFEKLRADGRRKLLLCGIETHVCVQQSALDLIAAGFRVYLAVDAV